MPVSLGGPRTTNPHSYWDTVAVEAIDSDANKLAAKLAAQITRSRAKSLEEG